MSNNAIAGWISICDSKPINNSILFEKKYFKANGDSYWLFYFKDKPSNCESFQLDLDAADIRWLSIISKDKSDRVKRKIILQGTNKEQKLNISEIIADLPEATSTISRNIGIKDNLLDQMSFKPFGVESRASFTVENNKTKIRCVAGKKPAGILFEVKDKKLPQFFSVAMQLNYRANARFLLGIADAKRYQQGNPVLFDLPQEKNKIQLSIPYQRINKTKTVHWSLVCPEHTAEIALKDFSLIPLQNVQTNHQRDLWIWRPQAWQNFPEKTIDLLKKYKAQRVFISVELNKEETDILHPVALKNFLALASENKIKVWVVEGDPYAVLPKGQEQFARRAKVFETFNQQQNIFKLAGLQYDIEPYLIPGWDLDQTAGYDAYRKTLKNIKSQTSLPVEIVIPFWWQFISFENDVLLNAMAPYIDGINIMNYRTTEKMIQLFAQPFIEWGTLHNKKVSIALEAGPIPDETRWHYYQSDKGELWLLDSFSQPILILLKSKQKNFHGKVFSLQHESMLSGDVITFKNNPNRLLEMLPQLEKSWSHWPSFQGISLHGFEDELYPTNK